MSYVFVSHTNEDREDAARLCELLESNSIKTWVSFRDIKAGAHWDEEIEAALGAAEAVVVLATAQSVQSKYVRAEVEGALSEQLTVIPVVMGEVTLPLRWKALQFISWKGDADKRVASEIVRALPPIAHSTFASLLEDSANEIELRKLILNHTEWLPIEFNMHLHYRFLQNAETTKGCAVDCFAARMDSGGPRAYLYYLGSPYAEPFDATGVPTASTRALVCRLRRDLVWLTNELSYQHPLAPNNFLNYEGQWRPVPTINRFASVTIKALVGRRRHYVHDGANDARRSTALSIQAIVSSLHVSVELVSYDRVLESVRKESEGRAAWYRKYLRQSQK